MKEKIVVFLLFFLFISNGVAAHLPEDLEDPPRLLACVRSVFAALAPGGWSEPRGFLGPVIQPGKLHATYSVEYADRAPRAMLRFVSPAPWQYFSYFSPTGTHRYGAFAENGPRAALLESSEGSAVAELDLSVCLRVFGF